MIFPHPVTLKEAMETRAARAILPTDMSAKMLSTLPREVRERAIFSAGVQNVDFMTQAKEAIDKMVSGVTDRATQRTMLKQLAERFELTALQADSRLNLILDTQVKMANGFGSWIEGQHPSILLMWPASELYRAEDRKEPRDWPARWEEAGGEFYPGDADYARGRMIALKSDPIWTDISAFDLPYAPFDYNSGMDLRDIDRDEAVELGLIDEDDTQNPEERSLNDGLRASVGSLIGDERLGFALGQWLGDLASVSKGGIVKFLGQ